MLPYANLHLYGGIHATLDTPAIGAIHHAVVIV
jgi:hypothetical protein